MQPPERILYRAFADPRPYLDDLFDIYQRLYPVETISGSHQLADEHSFRYCQNRSFFVVVVPYTEHGDILVERSFTTNDALQWSLIGGSVDTDHVESFIHAATRHAGRVLRDMDLGEVEPIAFLENKFEYEGDSCIHDGIAFVARVRNSDLRRMLRKAGTKSELIPVGDRSAKFSLHHNDKVVELLRQSLRRRPSYDPPEEEVAENQRYSRRYHYHNRYIKPLFRFASRYFGGISLEDFSQMLLNEIFAGEPATFLDVACGENNLVLDVAKNNTLTLAVGNDVSWSQVELLNKRSSSQLRDIDTFALFTNHDARALPFRDDYFDVAVCKNTLHHMEDLTSVRELLAELIRVSKKAIVVELMDPLLEGIWGRLRHRYYLDVLHDHGRYFLSSVEFEKLTSARTRTKLYSIRTLRCVYQIAVFEQ